MRELPWEHDPFMQWEKARTDVGVYTLARSLTDMSILRFNGTELHRCGSGSHEKNRKRAEEHYAARKEEQDDA